MAFCRRRNISSFFRETSPRRSGSWWHVSFPASARLRSRHGCSERLSLPCSSLRWLLSFTSNAQPDLSLRQSAGFPQSRSSTTRSRWLAHDHAHVRPLNEVAVARGGPPPVRGHYHFIPSSRRANHPTREQDRSRGPD